MVTFGVLATYLETVTLLMPQNHSFFDCFYVRRYNQIVVCIYTVVVPHDMESVPTTYT